MNSLVKFIVPLLLSQSFLSAQNETRNKGAGIAPEVLNVYEAHTFEGMPYRFLLPENYNPKKKYPLILNLHGRGGIGDDNETQMRNWTEVFADKAWRKKYPCIVVAPQSWDSWSVFNERNPELSAEEIASFGPAWQKRFESGRYTTDVTSTGSLSMAFLLVDKISRDFSVDKKRIYVMGHSMGGAGSWNALWEAPERFAAAIPTAGGLPPWKDKTRFKDVPIWTFHGDVDPTVPFSFSQEIFDSMKAAGGNLKFTVLKDVKHNASDYAFYYKGDEAEKGFITHTSSDRCDPTPDVWDWLFRQKLK
ncbi:MAG: alpha/beta hydrolase-fold protein [Verrucomicrobia bacterium]|nr:alpha/beta hydrolase-fold protein [Verrucomicrobiota bacterium]MDA1066150.1 alpha/beta hydrolase-fold protein [Verrucomicrobiota bacterium]